MIGKQGIMQKNLLLFLLMFVYDTSVCIACLALLKQNLYHFKNSRKHYLIIKEVDCMPIQLERQCFQKGNIIRHHLKHK